MKKHAFEAVIFDLDGTLIDTETADFEACKKLFHELGASITLEYWAEKVVGRTDGHEDLLQELVQHTHNGLTKAELWLRIQELWTVTLQNVTLMPGVEDLLTQLRAADYPLGVATASDRKWATRWLTKFRLHSYFKTISTGDDVVHNKPAPDVYLLAAAQLGVAPRHCLVFEDSAAGAESAKAAGMTVVAIATPITKHLDFSHADSIVSGLNQVTTEWVKSLTVTTNRII